MPQQAERNLYDWVFSDLQNSPLQSSKQSKVKIGRFVDFHCQDV